MPKKIVSLVLLMATLPTSVAERIVEAWARGLKAEAVDMYVKLLARIPSMGKYVERIGQPSSNAYHDTINPTFISRSGENAQSISISQAANIKRTYQKYEAKLKYLFETVDGIPAKRYKERVDAMKEAFRSGTVERNLAFTGTKIEGKGCAPLAAFWLVKDRTVQDYLRAGDKMQAPPFMICLPEDVPSLKATLTSRLVQAGASIVKAEYDRDIMKHQNDRTNRIVQGFVDPALNLLKFETGGDSHVDYIRIDDQLFLEVKVTQK